MFVKRVTAIHRGTEIVEVKAKIFNTLIKYVLLIILIDGGKKGIFAFFFLCGYLNFCCIVCGVFT